MAVGLNKVQFKNMDRLCDADNKHHLSKLFDVEGQKASFSCDGSKRCCTQCKMPHSSAQDQNIPPVDVVTLDELQKIHHRGLFTMVIVLIVELVICIIVACCRYAHDDLKLYQELGPKTEGSLDMVVKRDNRKVICKLVYIVSTVIGLVVLVAEMCLMITLVLVPAAYYLTDITCYLYMLKYATTIIATYICIGVLIERYIATTKHMDKQNADMGIWKTALSILWIIMCLLTTGSLAGGAIYIIVSEI